MSPALTILFLEAAYGRRFCDISFVRLDKSCKILNCETRDEAASSRSGSGYFPSHGSENGGIRDRLPPMAILIITEKTSQARDLRFSLAGLLPSVADFIRV